MTKLEQLREQLRIINKRINSITKWNEQTQDLQIMYDRLLSEYNKLLKEQNHVG